MIFWLEICILTNSTMFRRCSTLQIQWKEVVWDKIGVSYDFSHCDTEFIEIHNP